MIERAGERCASCGCDRVRLVGGTLTMCAHCDLHCDRLIELTDPRTGSTAVHPCPLCSKAERAEGSGPRETYGYTPPTQGEQ